MKRIGMREVNVFQAFGFSVIKSAIRRRKALKVERRLIKEATEEIAKREAQGCSWKAIIGGWEADAKSDGGEFKNPLTGKNSHR